MRRTRRSGAWRRRSTGEWAQRDRTASITAGDFNQAGTLALAGRAWTRLETRGAAVCHPSPSLPDFIFSRGASGDKILVADCVVAGPQANKSEKVLTSMYARGQVPRWPSDHPLVRATLVLRGGDGNPPLQLTVATWNVMTQGLTRRARKGEVGLVAARRQATHVTRELARVLHPRSGVDILFLQEAGGSAWRDFFRPVALEASSGMRVRGLARAADVIGDAEGWVMVAHKRDDLEHGVGSVTLVRGICLPSGHVRPKREREARYGEAAHTSSLAVLWHRRDGARVPVRTNLTNVHAFPWEPNRVFTFDQLSASLGVIDLRPSSVRRTASHKAWAKTQSARRRVMRQLSDRSTRRSRPPT